jgi:hypothetical protein
MQKPEIAFGHKKRRKRKSDNWRNSDVKKRNLSVGKKN